MKELIGRLVKDEEGATIIEYVLLASLISIIAIASIRLIGTNINAKYTNVATETGK